MPHPDFKVLIRNISDFPLPGVQFKDITTLIRDGEAFRAVVDHIADHFRDEHIEYVVGVESRGFIFSAPVAYQLGAGLIPIRKPGKLPAEIVEVAYALEYGTNVLQMHADAFPSGARVLLLDDLLATGGTIAAAADLVEQLGGHVVGLAFVIELTDLQGREHLSEYPIFSVIQY